VWRNVEKVSFQARDCKREFPNVAFQVSEHQCKSLHAPGTL
jgi:hypothetical protein